VFTHRDGLDLCYLVGGNVTSSLCRTPFGTDSRHVNKPYDALSMNKWSREKNRYKLTSLHQFYSFLSLAELGFQIASLCSRIVTQCTIVFIQDFEMYLIN
jgi:hypothetical protein